MSRSWGSFRTTEGTVSVGPQAIHIDRTPRSMIAGLLAGWRNGGLRRRLTVGYRLLFLGLVPVFTIHQLARALDLSLGLAIAAGFGWIALTLVPLALRYREAAIDRSAIVDVSLDPDARQLTVEHEADSGWGALVTRFYRGDSRPFEGAARTTTLALAGEDDVRAARTTLRTAGIVEEFESEPDGPTTTRHRVETIRGVVFCEACGAQVSPADQSCPRCSTALRVEEPAEPHRAG